MKLLFAMVASLCAVACSNVGSEPATADGRFVGIYEGRDVIDTQEIITLRKDHSFTYDFIPFLRDGGASYNGRWKIVGADLILVARRESGEEEEFSLGVSYQESEPLLTYTWAAEQRQRATMLIPNVFVRSKKASAYRPILPREIMPNQSSEPTPPSVTDRAGARSAPAGGVAHL